MSINFCFTERAKYYMLRDRMCSHCPMTFQNKEDCHRHCVNAHPETCEELPETNVQDPLDITLARTALDDTANTKSTWITLKLKM